MYGSFDVVHVCKFNTVQFEIVVVVGLNAIFQHMIGYTWRPLLMVEEETGKSAEITTDP